MGVQYPGMDARGNDGVGRLLTAIPLSIFLVVLSWRSEPLDTDTIGLIVVIVAVAVVLIADKLRQQGQKKDPPA